MTFTAHKIIALFIIFVLVTFMVINIVFHPYQNIGDGVIFLSICGGCAAAIMLVK